MADIDIAQILTYFLAMLFSLSIHEAAHAWLAYLRGDSTAKDEGRMTLNPISHVDPVGTVILPLVGAVFHLPIIGWAKPVPVDLRRVKNPKWDNVLIAAGGPVSNLLLCFVCVVFLAMHARFFSAAITPESFFHPLIELLVAMTWVNAFLAFFNLIPLPPLDGAAVLGAVLPHKWSLGYERYVRPYGYVMLMMLIISGGLHWLPKVAAQYVGLAQLLVATIL